MNNSIIVRAILMLIGTTVFEVVGLVGWLELDARGLASIGLPLLYVALVIERMVVAFPSNRQSWLIVLGSAWIEYAVWALWFLLITEKGLNPIAIFILVLLPGIHIQHAFVSSQTMNRSFTEFVQHPYFIAFSLIEAVGGGLWLAAVQDPSASPIPAFVIIAVAITIEHIVQGVALNAINQDGIVAQMAQVN